MSGNKKKNDEDGGLGFGAAVMLGAGAAVAGFLARGLWNSYQETQGQSSSSGRRPSNPPPPPPRSNSTSNWEKQPDKNFGARKKQRESFRDNIPDEMKCVACLDNPREVCLVPCGHVCLCEDCVEKINKKCPMCQQHIENKKVIYM